MIKINLSAAPKQVDISNLGGFDLTRLKIKFVILAIVILYSPDFLLVPLFEAEVEAKNAELGQLQGQANSLKRKVSQSADLEKQIRELKAQEENLGQKLTAVKQAISLKRNPSNLVLYIAKNIPNDLWINELTIENEVLSIKGESMTYTSVGNFISNLRSSVFIKDATINSSSSTVRESDKKRIEKYDVKFGIARFE